jgi:hypothetical protein
MKNGTLEHVSLCMTGNLLADEISNPGNPDDSNRYGLCVRPDRRLRLRGPEQGRC